MAMTHKPGALRTIVIGDAPRATGLDLTFRPLPTSEPPGGYWPVVNRLGRCDVVALLEAAGFACYDHETADELRAELVRCLRDGDVLLADVGVLL